MGQGLTFSLSVFGSHRIEDLKEVVVGLGLQVVRGSRHRSSLFMLKGTLLVCTESIVYCGLFSEENLSLLHSRCTLFSQIIYNTNGKYFGKFCFTSLLRGWV